MDFDMLGLAPRLIAALKEQGITEPTPIQTQAIPHAMNGRDVMGLAQTGSGKTAAFGLPMIDALIKNGVKPNPKTTRGLVLAPTRELAKQIADHLTAYTSGTHLKIVLVTGGAGIVGQINKLDRGVSLVVATPGRLIDLIDRRAITLHETRFLVLDEADQMLDLGFIHALRRMFVEKLRVRAPAADFGFILEQRGMFSYSGLTKEQMQRLRAEYSIYGLDTGRICVAALNARNIGSVVDAVANVME